MKISPALLSRLHPFGYRERGLGFGRRHRESLILEATEQWNLVSLADLVPPPRAYLTRFHGVLAPHSKLRSKVVPKGEAKQEGEGKVPKKARMSWAKLLKRVFGIDMENCGQYVGMVEILAATMEGAASPDLREIGQSGILPE